MKKILITTGEDQFSRRQIKSLQYLIEQNYRTYISNEKTRIIWSEVVIDNLFHNYKKEQNTILIMECKKGVGQEQRAQMCQACSRDWLRITGQGIDQLVIGILETLVFSALLQRNSQCLSVMGKMRYHIKIAINLLWSRISKGYFSLSLSS